MDLKEAKELAHKRLGDKRYRHTLNVEKMAVKLAKRYGADCDQAALAGPAPRYGQRRCLPPTSWLCCGPIPTWRGTPKNRPTPIWHGGVRSHSGQDPVGGHR